MRKAGLVFLLAAAFLSPAASAASPAAPPLVVHWESPVAPMRNVIDFFFPFERDLGPDLRALRPRFYVSAFTRDWKDGQGVLTYFPPADSGVERVAIFGGFKDSAEVAWLMDTAKVLGIRHFELWTEPNRTWNDFQGRGGSWVSEAQWRELTLHAAKLARWARARDTGFFFHAPVLSTDAETGKDPDWLAHLAEFVWHFVDAGLRLDYLNVNPPYRPEDVLTVSSFAAGLAARYPALGLKGISLGEYPFFNVHPGRNLRFLLAFEECPNLLFAARSHYRKSPTNTGLILEDGSKTPLYWVYREYARQRGMRLRASAGSRDVVTLLANRFPGTDSGSVLVANDRPRGGRVAIRFAGLAKPLEAGVYRFSAEGPELLFRRRLSVRANTLDLGEVEAEGARLIRLEAAPR